MDVIQSLLETLNIDPNVTNVLLCAVLCVVGFVVILVLSVVGNLLGILVDFLELAFDVASSGPVGALGCLAVLFGCAVITFMVILNAIILPYCQGTNPVMICRFFG